MSKQITILISILYLFSIVFFAQNVIAENSSEFEFLYMNSIKENTQYSVAYKIQNLELDKEYNFDLKVYYNNELQKDTCQEKFIFDKNTIMKKKSCLIKNSGFGEYKFEATLNGEKFQKTLENTKKIEETITEFITENGKTTVEILVNSNKNNTYITSEIPKSVIESLTEENKDKLLISNYDYEILEEDPLIAWNIENPPAKINYVVEKEITTEEKNNFKTEIIDKDTKEFQYLKYIIFLLIIGIIIAIAIPAIKKQKK